MVAGKEGKEPEVGQGYATPALCVLCWTRDLCTGNRLSPCKLQLCIGGLAFGAVAVQYFSGTQEQMGGTSQFSSVAMDLVSVYRSRDSCQDIDVSCTLPVCSWR